MNISDAQIAAALDRLIGTVLTPDEIDRRIDQWLDRKIGTVDMATAARKWGLSVPAFRLTCTRLGIPVEKIGRRIVRIAIPDLERALAERKRLKPGTNRRKKLSPAPSPLTNRAA
jgi:hypothetical protein